VMRGTTILAIKEGDKIAMAGDGQVTAGDVVMKAGAKKVRKLYNDKVIAGFAGSTADAFTLFEKFEQKLEQYNGQLLRAAVELAKDWRTDKFLRRLEAMMIVGNQDGLLVLTGSGDVIEPDDNIAGIGSGGSYAVAAARGLMKHPGLAPIEVVSEALNIASDLCIYTNKNLTDEKCSKCGKPMVIKTGKFGRFMACSGYPDCTNTKPFTLGIKCPKCNKGELAERQSRRGKVFYSCDQYPKCDYASWDKPIDEPCPQCKHPFLTIKTTKKTGTKKVCPNKECGYSVEIDEPENE